MDDSMTPDLAKYKANLLLNDYRGLCRREGKDIEAIPAELFHLIAMAGHSGAMSRDKVRSVVRQLLQINPQPEVSQEQGRRFPGPLCHGVGMDAANPGESGLAHVEIKAEFVEFGQCHITKDVSATPGSITETVN